ncbi:hypothetical protein ES703_49855 [subsurface metagenome]
MAKYKETTKEDWNMKVRLDALWQVPRGMERHLRSTELIDLDSEVVRETTKEVIGDSTTPKEAAIRIFYFVRDEIKFALTPQLERASTVIERRTGYCVGKATALVAMLRVANIPARYHFASIKKEVMKGLMGKIGYRFTPKVIPAHTWVDIYLNSKWIGVEFSYDKELFEVMKEKKMGIYEKGIELETDWDGEHDLLVPPEFLVEDLGVYESPEAAVKREMLWPLWQYLQNRGLKRIREKS